MNMLIYSRNRQLCIKLFLLENASHYTTEEYCQTRWQVGQLIFGEDKSFSQGLGTRKGSLEESLRSNHIYFEVSYVLLTVSLIQSECGSS